MVAFQESWASVQSVEAQKVTKTMVKGEEKHPRNGLVLATNWFPPDGQEIVADAKIQDRLTTHLTIFGNNFKLSGRPNIP